MRPAYFRLDAALAPPAESLGLRVAMLLRAASALLAAADRLVARRAARPAVAVREIEPQLVRGRPALAVFEDGRLVGYIDGIDRL